MIRNRFISRLKRYHLRSGLTGSHLKGNRKVSGSGGSMIARLKLEGIDGKLNKTWSLRLNLTQHANLTRPRCFTEQQIESSFAIGQLVVHGRS